MEHLLHESINRVWNERDAGLRRQALAELYAADATLYEPDGVAIGPEAIANRVQELHAILGPVARLEYAGPILHHHGVAIGRWRVGPAGAPLATGTDVVHLHDNVVSRMYVFIDVPPGDAAA
ncbi:hypothetical protein C7I55_03425 [Sphingomonas deserti]|uniref:SnoaL-like domain-containing protein n=1 Tax=Allosphingosinicella deserti TaxID=2116704 RepID=A0A2P7QZP7_9SPHN|nr:hypothetical protein C7I55_03425 [Sphingomonas deserti]